MSLLVLVAAVAGWRTPITKYTPKTPAEREIAAVIINYVTARNNRDVPAFLSTLHSDCTYMVTKDLIVGKNRLKTMLPELWMQNDDNHAAFGRCMAWECWHENNYRHVMLINPRFRISGVQATVACKIVSGLFMDDNYFQLVNENGAWQISQFMRPIY